MGDEDDYVCEVNLKDAPISITHHLEVLGERLDDGTHTHFRDEKMAVLLVKNSETILFLGKGPALFCISWVSNHGAQLSFAWLLVSYLAI